MLLGLSFCSSDSFRIRYVSLEVAIYIYLCYRGVYVVAPLLLMPVMRYVSLYLAVYFYLFVKCCLSCCSSFTHVVDAVCLFLYSYLFLPFCQMLVILLLHYYSFLLILCVSLYLVIYLYHFFNCSSFTHFFDSVFPPLFSCLCLPLFQLLFIWLPFSYSFL